MKMTRSERREHEQTNLVLAARICIELLRDAIRSDPAEAERLVEQLSQFVDEVAVVPGREEDAPCDAGAGRGRVLVVDDEPNVREVIVSALRRRGFDVSSAATGGDAIAMATDGSAPPDVVVIDESLPDRPGSACAADLLRAREGIRVILMPGVVTSHLGSLDPAIEILPKPFAVSTLCDRLAAGAPPAT